MSDVKPTVSGLFQAFRLKQSSNTVLEIYFVYVKTQSLSNMPSLARIWTKRDSFDYVTEYAYYEVFSYSQ